MLAGAAWLVAIFASERGRLVSCRGRTTRLKDGTDAREDMKSALRQSGFSICMDEKYVCPEESGIKDQLCLRNMADYM